MKTDFKLAVNGHHNGLTVRVTAHRKKILEIYPILLHFIDLQTTPSYNDMKHKNRNGIDVEDVESLDLVASPESNSSCLIV